MEEDTVINVTVTKETAIIDAVNAVMETMDGVTIITDGATEIIITITLGKKGAAYAHRKDASKGFKKVDAPVLEKGTKFIKIRLHTALLYNMLILSIL